MHMTATFNRSVLALLSHDQLQEIGVDKMGDRAKLHRRAVSYSSIQLSTYSSAQPSAREHIEMDRTERIGSALQTTQDSSLMQIIDSHHHEHTFPGVESFLPTAFHDTFLVHGRKV